MTLKMNILGQNFADFGRFEGSFFTILGVKNVDFSTFSKLFGKCLGIIFGLKEPTFGCIFRSKGW